MSELYVPKASGSTPRDIRNARICGAAVPAAAGGTPAPQQNAACSGFAGNLKLNVISGNLTTSRSTADRAALAMHRIAVLGSTGSIGTNCLDVIGSLPERLNLQGIAARTSWQLLGQQTERFAPRWAVLSDASLRHTVPRSAFSSKTEVLVGPEGV